MQRSRSPQELVAAYRAKEWVEYAASTPYPYEHIKAVFAGLDSDIEDDVAADFTEGQVDERLERYAKDPAGRSMLDVLTRAMITGNVTAFETLQADRILNARGKSPAHHAKDATRIAGLRDQAEDTGVELMVDRLSMGVAQSMTLLVAAQRYGEVTKEIQDSTVSYQDDVAAHLIELLTTPQLEAAARVPAGRIMLDVCYDATRNACSPRRIVSQMARLARESYGGPAKSTPADPSSQSPGPSRTMSADSQVQEKP